MRYDNAVVEASVERTKEAAQDRIRTKLRPARVSRSPNTTGMKPKCEETKVINVHLHTYDEQLEHTVTLQN